MVGVIMFNIKKMFTKNMSGYAKNMHHLKKKITFETYFENIIIMLSIH